MTTTETRLPLRDAERSERTTADTTLTLLDADGSLRSVPLGDAVTFEKPTSPLRTRVAYAAAHVAPLAHGDNTSGAPAEIDWDATLAFRRTLWSWGLGVADAMDTAQRNMGLDAAATRELIDRSTEAAREALADPDVSRLFPEDAQVSDLVVAGVNTDHRTEAELSLDEVIAAYREQLAATEATGAGAVLMASRHLARAATGPEDYEHVYREVLSAATAPVVLHWLGTVFDPQLEGYFGSTDTSVAAEVLLRIVGEAPGRIRGVKMSLLDDSAEVAVRERLPQGVRMLTGDDFHFSHLIVGNQVAGDEDGYSDALLGAFSVTAPAASAAIQKLDAGDRCEAARILSEAERLARHVFSTPTYHYKTGVAFLAWLNGHQPAFSMVGGMHSARSLPHLSRTVELAAETGNLERPELAAGRWHAMLRLAGYEIPGTGTGTDAVTPRTHAPESA